MHSLVILPCFETQVDVLIGVGGILDFHDAQNGSTLGVFSFPMTHRGFPRDLAAEVVPLGTRQSVTAKRTSRPGFLAPR